MFDTAGLRKRARVDEKLEKLAGADALRAAKFAEVVVLLIDAAAPLEKQDLTLADLIAREGRALVIGVSKWDLVQDRAGRLKELREEASRLLPQLKGTAVVPVSGATGEGIDALMAAVFAVHVTWNKRVSTGRLNRWLAAALEANPPPAVSGRRIKIRYITQQRARPPYFIIFGNQLASLPESYKRFLTMASARPSISRACRSGFRPAPTKTLTTANAGNSFGALRTLLIFGALRPLCVPRDTLGESFPPSVLAIPIWC